MESLAIEDVAQPEKLRRRLIRYLRPALADSRELTRVHSAEMADGALLGEVSVFGESVELSLYIIDKQRREEVAAVNVEMSKADVVGSGVAARLAECAAHFGADRVPEAAQCYREVRKLDLGNAPAQAGLARIEERYVESAKGAIRRGEFAEARGHVERLGELSPEHSRVPELEGEIAGAERKAEAEARRKREQEAAERKAEEERRRAEERYVESAKGAIRRGKLAEARIHVERLGELNPEHPRVLDLEGEIAEAERKAKERRAAAEAEARRKREQEEARRKAEEERRRAEERRIAELTPEMVRIEGGCFVMGSPGSETGREDDERWHRVCVEAFSIGKHEVTFAEYDRFAEATGRSRPADAGWGRERRPVINVSWDDATAYARWLSGETGRRYRLPTEAEWEYAARAGSTTAYPWGNSVGNGRANCFVCGSQWDNNQTAPVGSFEANAWGVHDTVGNVCEWTCSEYDEGYEGAEQRCTSGSVGLRVIRGGAWSYLPVWVRSAYRLRDGPNDRSYDLGFRLAQD